MHIPTDAELNAQRRKMAGDATEVALKAAGGRLSCSRLAEIIGTSAHSLHHLLGRDLRFRKIYEPMPGRGLSCTCYELTTPETPDTGGVTPAPPRA
jgi:hypothetical protein